MILTAFTRNSQQRGIHTFPSAWMNLVKENRLLIVSIRYWRICRNSVIRMKIDFSLYLFSASSLLPPHTHTHSVLNLLSSTQWLDALSRPSRLASYCQSLQLSDLTLHFYTARKLKHRLQYVVYLARQLHTVYSTSKVDSFKLHVLYTLLDNFTLHLYRAKERYIAYIAYLHS